MGLDLVEVLLEVEETFGIEIPEERAGKHIETVGQFADMVADVVAEQCHAGWSRDDVIKKTVEIIRSVSTRWSGEIVALDARLRDVLSM